MSSAPPAGRNADLHERINQLDSRVLELQSTVLTKDGYVDRRNREDDHIRREMETQRATSHRLDLNVVALRSDVAQINSRLDSVNLRLDSMASHMRLSDRVRFNTLAHTISAPISSVPVITDNGVLEWPKYFPRTVWKFWCSRTEVEVRVDQ
jgi:chromosome segregation ATPase